MIMPLSHVNPEHYQQQLDEKLNLISEQFSAFYPGTVEVFSSAPLHFRMRAEFRLWHQGDECYYVMFDPAEPKTPVRMDDFSIGSVLINQQMKALLPEVNASPLLKKRLFQVEFLTSLSDECLITLIYHKKLDEQWIEEARELQSTLNCQIIGRSKKQKLVLENDFITETLSINNQPYHYQQTEGSFTQPNAGVNQHMLSWATQHSTKLDGDLLELYCGNGNFTLPLSKNFNKVLATEISKTSVRSAKYNFDLNNVSNVAIARMSSEEFTEALNGVREFRRLKAAEIELSDYNFSTVFVDPPRAGLDQDTVKLISQFENIIYISCNPNTLHENIQALAQTHRIEHFAIFDQFPYTHHTECGVFLKNKRLKNTNPALS
jgi:tRNA (uracil-5-)-methyltransferase